MNEKHFELIFDLNVIFISVVNIIRKISFFILRFVFKKEEKCNPLRTNNKFLYTNLAKLLTKRRKRSFFSC